MDSLENTDQTDTNAAPDVGAAPKSAPNWQEQDDLLRSLWLDKMPPEEIAQKLGRTVAAVMTRAVRLGLPRRASPGRKPGYKRTDLPKNGARRRRAGAGPLGDMPEEPVEQPVPRVCLMCLNKFPSLGRHNRICPSCKGSSEYASGSSVPDASFRVET